MHPCAARVTRGFKAALIVLPFLVLGLLGSISISVNTNRPSEQTVVAATQRPKPSRQAINFRSKIERSHVCETNQSVNASVLAVCEEVARDRREYYTPRDRVVNPYPHRFLIDASHLCSPSTEVVFLVHSLHNYADRRQAIRETWGGAAVGGNWPRASIGFRVILAFVLGLNHDGSLDKLLKKESEEHRDIIQGDFFEDYHNMTLKSLLGLKWVHDYCPHAKFLIKSDDDMIINVPYLLDVLARTNMTRALLGPYNENSRVMRRGKWSIPYDVFPFYYYPPYESGAAYVISGDLVEPLFTSSQFVPSIFIDDVYITGILAEVLQARHVKIYGFSYWNSKRLQPCDIMANRMFTGTKMAPSNQIEMWKTIKTGRYCR